MSTITNTNDYKFTIAVDLFQELENKMNITMHFIARKL